MEQIVDLSQWPRAEQYHFYKTYDRPHFAVTSRLDVTDLMVRLNPSGASPYRTSLYAIGAGLHAVPELLMRFRDDTVVRHDTIELSMTVPTTTGSFAFAYVPFLHDFDAFDTQAKALIAAAATGDLAPNKAGERDDLAYLSCMPWLDYTSLNNAMPGPEECIPRVGRGKLVQDGALWSMPMTLEVHHALADGAHVGAFFAAVQAALDGF